MAKPYGTALITHGKAVRHSLNNLWQSLTAQPLSLMAKPYGTALITYDKALWQSLNKFTETP